MKTYLSTLKTHVVNLKRDAIDLSRDLQTLEVCGNFDLKLSNVLQQRLSKLLNEPPLRPTGTTSLEKLVQENHNIIFDQPLRCFIALRLHFYLYHSNV